MRYNIKRLFNEVITYEKEIIKLQKEYKEATPTRVSEICYQLNSRRHAKSLCVSYIGQEVMNRWKEGKNLNVESEEVELIKI